MIDIMQWLTIADAIDLAAAAIVAAVLIGAPLVGWLILVVDVRRWLRALRARTLVVVNYLSPRRNPYREAQDRPPCLEVFGLSLPCTERELLAAYRRRVKDLHPDRGGEMQEFLQLQKQFEQSLNLVRQRAEQMAREATATGRR
ncbi:MAG: hypothetical protein AAF961_19190 [Planctomycetota bacterium]